MTLKSTQVAEATITLSSDEVDLFAELAKARQIDFVDFIKDCALREARGIKGMLNELDRRDPPA